MHREIKFRGKRIDNGEWVYGDFRSSENSIAVACYIRHLGIGYDVYSISPETVGQFSGVKDDNGIEIFDNDIILINNSGVAMVTYVDFILSYIAVFIDKDKDNIMLCDLLDDEYVVIGNIYDNPELLKTE